MTDLARTARLDVLFEGYARMPNVAGTVSLVRDEGRVIVVDPGMVPSREALSGRCASSACPEDVTDVVLSHHHPDHTVNIALFPVVPVHDVQAVYTGDVWTQRPAEGVQLTASVRLLATPGHTAAGRHHAGRHADDVVALTHLWWTEQGPVEDPYAPDREELRSQRERVLALATWWCPATGRRSGLRRRPRAEERSRRA